MSVYEDLQFVLYFKTVFDTEVDQFISSLNNIYAVFDLLLQQVHDLLAL